MGDRGLIVDQPFINTMICCVVGTQCSRGCQLYVQSLPSVTRTKAFECVALLLYWH